MSQTKPPAEGVSSPARIFLGLVVGALGGIGLNLTCGGEPWLDALVRYVAEPVGQIFLRLMVMVVIPLVFSSLALGVAGLGDLKKLGRIGIRTLAYFLGVTALSVLLGLFLVNAIKPGVGLSPEIKTRLMELYQGDVKKNIAQAGSTGFSIQTFVEIVPRNPLKAAVNGDMLAVIFFALMCGVALTLIPQPRSAPVIACLEGIAEAMVKIIDLAMRLAPLGVGALIFSVTARFGFDLMVKLGLYVFTVVLGLLILQFGLYSFLIRWLGKLSPAVFFRAAEPVMLTAFSTSSSNATLPTTLRVATEELGVQKGIAGFVIPLGATMNMNGTALFEGVTVLFLGQVFGLELSLGAQLAVLGMAVLMAVGTAGVPGGTIPLLMLVLQTVGIPPEGIAIIMGVDRLLDMCRTVCNVTGDLTAAVFIARLEGMLHLPPTLPITATRPE